MMIKPVESTCGTITGTVHNIHDDDDAKKEETLLIYAIPTIPPNSSIKPL